MDINPAATAAQPAPDILANKPRRCSTFELGLTPFSDGLIEAASRGNISNAEPFIRHLGTTRNLCNGLRVVLDICGNNGVVEDNYDPDNLESEPPLGAWSVSVLIKMASEVCAMMSADIENLAQWGEKHAIRGGSKQ